jgi:DedD protein
VQQAEPIVPKEASVAAPGKAAPASAKGGAPSGSVATSSGGPRFVLQAAALSSESAARELTAKLKKAGFATYTEKVSTQEGDRIRVRVGPFATREDAEQARAKLKTLGINAGVVSG